MKVFDYLQKKNGVLLRKLHYTLKAISMSKMVRKNNFAKTHASCKAATNEIGICDIFGNVAEWIWDSTQAKTEEEKGLVGGDRYLCGGHAFSHDLSSPSKFCSPERPSTKNMNTGFRLVRTVSRPEQEDIEGGS